MRPLTEGYAKVARAVMQRRGLSGAAKLLYVLLQAHADERGECYPSIALLSQESGWSAPTVIKAIDALVAAGLVERQRRRFTNVYLLTDSNSFNPTRVKQVESVGDRVNGAESVLVNGVNDVESVQAKTGDGLNDVYRRIKPALPTDSTSFNPVNEPHLTSITEQDPESTCPGGAGGQSFSAEVREVFGYYRDHIQPQARETPGARRKIRARLKVFSADDLRAGIDHFAADAWSMEHNAHRGAEWYFHSDARSEQYLLLKPRPASVAGAGSKSGLGKQDYDAAQAKAYLVALGLVPATYEEPDDSGT